MTSVEDCQRMRHALESLIDDVRLFINAAGIYPAAESTAAKELADCHEPKQLETAYSQGHFLLESAEDHAFALTRLLVEPVPTIAPWTCARGGLEAAALSCWLLADGIDSRERISRSLAFRYEGLRQQLRLADATHDTVSRKKALHRIEEVEAQATALGYERVVDKHGKRIGIGQRMPTITGCVANTLDEEAFYRLCSAMVHANISALIELAFHATDAGEPNLLEKALNSDAVAILLMTAADTVAKPLWAKVSLFGQDLDGLAAILVRRYREMGLKGGRHFWIGAQPG